MKKEELMKDLFLDHHINLGLDEVEANDLYNESNPLQVEKWLLKRGYDLNEKII
jgi:hypothetical protein